MKNTRSRNDGLRTSSNTDNAKPTVDEIQRKPWKYIGINRYSEFMASDNDFYVLRRFDVLNIRVALALQDEISELEQELEAIDARFSDANAKDINNGTFRNDVEERSELIETIKKKLKRYSTYMSTKSWSHLINDCR